MDESETSTDLSDRSPKRFKKESGNKEPSDGEEVVDGRKWEDLPINCLVSVFGRLSLDDLTLGVPFVCKSWYEASLDPACWKILDFRAIDLWAGSSFNEKFMRAYRVEKFAFRGFLKYIISRSHKLATRLVLPESHFPLKGFGLCLQRLR
ncbi:uncharacterized protein LOC109833062 isoform X2 [Asparagus officinalis]|uniref:uncharacterized protein LOC109833062 isoform X2 n=1 Tax=Asparagus officinalis TaxID=4686 RepID=UPI00098E317E|nr:uncharacterized protein LOC109833062 isoform X2 [Asparagus officinalis]